MTVAGAERLRAELNELKSARRPRIIQAIADAREHGDLRENAEYHAAREQQSFCEGRIKEIEGKLADAEVIDVSAIPRTGRVIFGTTVTLLNLGTDTSVVYQIVGEDEADVRAGRISVGSPIARAIMGKEVGDEIVVKAPAGDIEYEIEAVEHLRVLDALLCLSAPCGEEYWKVGDRASRKLDTERQYCQCSESARHQPVYSPVQ